jgi:predicted RNA-binding Zn-ribbon protein involved in translation (DUF1610 family)
MLQAAEGPTSHEPATPFEPGRQDVATDDNTLIRSQPCADCGEVMLWTQAAWTEADGAPEAARAAYRCLRGHVLDPATTPQCPACGIHDTLASEVRGRFVCQRCGKGFSVGAL